MINPFDLTGRTVMVTGATSGIGAETAVFLSQLGARVIAVGRNEQRLAELLGRLEGDGHRSFAADLADIDSIAPWMKEVARQTGLLYGLVHSAGIFLNRPLRILNSKDLFATERINLDAAIMLAKGFRQKGVCAETGSSIVFISSSAAVRAPSTVAYSATKGALLSVTRTLAIELVRDKVRVNCVLPGLVKTRMAEDFDLAVPTDYAEQLRAAHPLGTGSPEDVAYAIAFLLAPAARWITGSTLAIDGGYTA